MTYIHWYIPWHIRWMYKRTPWKEHLVVDFWVTDEIEASEILFWNYLEYVPLKHYVITKKLKTTIFLWFTIFFCFKYAINVNDNYRVYFRKTKTSILQIKFLQKLLYRIAIKKMKRLFYQKTLARKIIKKSYSPQIWAKGRKNCLPWKKKMHTELSNYWFFLIKNAL